MTGLARADAVPPGRIRGSCRTRPPVYLHFAAQALARSPHWLLLLVRLRQATSSSLHFWRQAWAAASDAVDTLTIGIIASIRKAVSTGRINRSLVNQIFPRPARLFGELGKSGPPQLIAN